ncbi:MAG TPA: DUF4412 domain-containing protein [Verrucomicrobiae bacterium]|nr:DUF4412 domain-containing protein [Verrucomicrobiae bacterium]
MVKLNTGKGGLPLAMAIFLAVSAISQAQSGLPMSPGSGGAMNSALLKLFGNNTAFTAQTELRVVDNKAKKETALMPMKFTMLDGKVRADLDTTQIKSKEVAPEVIAEMKKMGMDSIISIQRLDKKTTLLIYPSLRACVETPMSKDEIAEATRAYKVEKTKLGRETVEGHACDKNKVVLTGDQGQKVEATVWNASDLKDFPVKIQMTDPDNTIVFTFKDVKPGRPDPGLFEAPEKFTKYDNVQRLMMAAMARVTNNAGK